MKLLNNRSREHVAGRRQDIPAEFPEAAYESRTSSIESDGCSGEDVTQDHKYSDYTTEIKPSTRYKTHNTPKRLAQLTDSRLKSAGVEDKDLRRLVLAAIKKAGYAPRHTATAAGPSTTSSNAPSRSANSQPETSVCSYFVARYIKCLLHAPPSPLF